MELFGAVSTVGSSGRSHVYVFHIPISGFIFTQGGDDDYERRVIIHGIHPPRFNRYIHDGLIPYISQITQSKSSASYHVDVFGELNV